MELVGGGIRVHSDKCAGGESRVRPSHARRFKGTRLLLAICCASAAGATGPSVTVVDLLRDLVLAGNEVLFSTDLVPPTLTAPPPDNQSSDLLSLVVKALAAHKLQLKSVGEHRYIVTRAMTPYQPASIGADVTGANPPLSALEEVLVFASHYTFENKPSREAYELDRRAIEQVPGTQNDALRAMRSVPGVAGTYSARPYIRGGTPDDVLVRFDGVTLNNPFHFREFQGLLSPFIPADVERIDIYSGGFPVRFGTRLGSVIDVVPRTVATGYELRADASRLGMDLSGSGKTERWPVEWLASVRRSPSDTNILQPIDANPSDPEFFDALVRARWIARANASLTIGWLLLNDNARARAEARDEIATAHSRNAYAWLAWDWSPIPALQSHSSLSYNQSDDGHFGQLRLSGVANGSLTEHHDFRSLAACSEWVYVANDALLWNLGAEFTSESADLRYQQDVLFASPLISRVIPVTQSTVDSTLHLHSSTFALFGSVRQHWRALETELGVRLDTQDYRDFGVRSQFTPRMNLRYDPAANWHVYASWGEFGQAQRIDEFREEQDQSSPDAASRASHSVVGIAHESLATTRWRIELYRNHWSSVSPYETNALGLVTLLPELQPDRLRVSPLSAESDGIEFSARQSLGTHLTIWGTFSLSQATDKLPGVTVARSWDQRQAANMRLAWNGPRFTGSVLAGWHSGWPRTSISAIAGSTDRASYLLLGSPNAERWGDYLSIDAHLSHSLYTRHGEVSLWLDITNATNHNSGCCTELAPVVAPESHTTWSADAWPGRTVNVGLTWRLWKPAG